MKFRRVLAGIFALAILVASSEGATIASYHFDKAGTSTTYSDGSGNGHDAVFNRPVTASADNPFGAGYSLALSVNATTAKLSNPGSINLREGSGGDSSFTLEGWIKPSTIGQMVFIQLATTTDGRNTIQLILTSDGKPEARLRTDGAVFTSATSETAISTSEWSHLALVYSESEGLLRLYVNAVEMASKSVSNVSIPAVFDTISFGGDGTNQVKGLVADIRISDVALSAGELGFHAAIPEPSALAWVVGSAVAFGVFHSRSLKL